MQDNSNRVTQSQMLKVEINTESAGWQPITLRDKEREEESARRKKGSQVMAKGVQIDVHPATRLAAADLMSHLRSVICMTDLHSEFVCSCTLLLNCGVADVFIYNRDCSACIEPSRL